MKKLFLILCFSLILIMVYGQSNNWNGGTGDWNVDANWSLGHVPLASEQVSIISGTVTIPNGVVAIVRNIQIRGTLILSPVGELIAGGGAFYSIDNLNEVYNYGKITINNAVLNGIKNEGLFENEGTINIVSGIGSEGILNIELFNNRSTGIISISNTGDHGISSSDSLTQFNNYGIIQLTSGIGKNGIDVSNFSQFRNYSNGSIIISNTGSHGINVQGAMTSFINDGSIDILSGILGNGIFNSGGSLVSNSSGATIDILSGLSGGIYNSAANTQLINSGIITMISGIQSAGILNGSLALFKNENCGRIFINYSIDNFNSFINEGFIAQNYDGGLNFNTGSFQNKGIIEDLKNAFNGLSISNDGYLFRPLVGNFTEAQAVSNAILGNGLGLTILNNQWYADQFLSIPAGTYNKQFKTWTPTGVAIGYQSFYLSVDDGNGCPQLVKVVLSSPVQSSCEIEWGGGAGDWDDPSKWDKLRIPTTCDSIIIGSGGMVDVPAAVTGLGRTLNNQGILVIQATGSITLDGASESGILNTGSITNHGEISIDNVGSEGLHHKGITADFSNYGTIILSSGIGNLGIFNDRAMNFVNYPSGLISISNTTSDAITNHGTPFTNYGQVNLLAGIGRYGIFNAIGSTLTNQLGGNINIGNSVNKAIINSGSGTIFNNYASINIQGSIGSDGLVNSVNAAFNNESGGVININGVASNGIVNSNNAVFANNFGAQIMIGSTLLDGVENNSNLINSGQLIINTGIGSLGIQNEISGFIDNGACGVIHNKFPLENEGTISNIGYFHHDIGTAVINNGSIVNSGVIEDFQGSFSGVSMVNNGNLIAPLVGTFTEGVPVPNVLQGNGTGLTVMNGEFYTFSNFGQSAGIYNSSNNTWIPNNFAVALDEFYLMIDNGNGCPEPFKLKLSSPVLPACVGGVNMWNVPMDGDWDVPGNWSLGHAPKSCEEVHIPAGVTVTIQAGTFAEAQSIDLQGHLVNNQQLILSGAEDRPGIHNFGGIIDNNGLLLISQVNGLNTDNHGIRNEGMGAQVNNTHTINIDDTDNNGVLNMNGAVLNLNGLTEISNTGGNSILNETGGLIMGIGDYALHSGIMVNEGTLNPGNSIGAMVLDGSYSSSLTTNLDMEIEGLTGGGMPGGFDFIEINGDLTLHGTLNVFLGGGFIPLETDVISLLSYTGSLTGSFAAENLPSPQMDGWQVDYGVLKPGQISLYKVAINNLCGAAIPIVQTTIATTLTPGHTLGASNGDNPGTCTTDLSTAPGIWYKLTVSNYLDYQLSLCNSDFDTKIGLFSGSCGGLNCIKGNDDDNALNGLGICSISLRSSISLTASEIENEYPGQVTSDIYIYISGYNTNLGQFELQIISSQPPCIPDTNEWLGINSLLWNDVGNWSLGHIPLPCEHLIVQSVPLIVPPGYLARANSIYLNGDMTIEGQLDISGANGQPGLDVSGGVLINNNILNITDITGITGHGLSCIGPAMVTNNGIMYIENTGGHNVYLMGNAGFSQNGILHLK